VIPRQAKNSKVGSIVKLVVHAAEKILPKAHIQLADPQGSNAKRSKARCIKRKDPSVYNGKQRSSQNQAR